MADISLIQDVCMDDCDEGVFEQGDSSSGSSGDDDILPPLPRIQQYAQSGNVFDRQMVARIVQEMFRTVPADILSEEIPNVMAVVRNLGEKDEAMVRADLLEQIPHMASQALKYSDRVEPLKNVISDYLLPLVVRNLGCSDNAVDKAAHSALIHLLQQGLISKLQAEIQVCPAILALSSEGQSTELKMGAITLMSKMAPILGQEITERVFLKRFTQICSSSLFYGGNVCASHMKDFCTVVGKKEFEKTLLPCYITLCHDEVWGVKIACAEVIMFVSTVSSPEIRRNILTPAFTKLLQDECRWVKTAAFKALGPFITTFADPPITNTAYDIQGELIFVNKEGNEFLLNTTSIPDVTFCKFLPRQGMNSGLGKSCNGVLNEVIGDWWQMDEEDSKMKMELVDHVSTDLDKEKVLDGDLDTIIPIPYTDTNCIKQSDEDIKEIVETVKNAVLSYRNVEQEHGVIGDNLKINLSKTNVISNVNKANCDNLVSAVTELEPEFENLSLNSENDVSTSILTEATKDQDPSNSVETILNVKVDNIEQSQVNLNCESEAEDNLHLYNSYNYWYISPDMTLDLSILEGPLTLGKADSDDLKTNVQHAAINLDSKSNSSKADEIIFSHQSGSEIAKADNAEDGRDQDIVPQVLLDHFFMMTDSSFTVKIDDEMSYYCAYSLPAVALTLGSKGWPLLKDTIERLAADMQYKVRRTVASCLHELALILGRDIATDHLTVIFDGFIKDLDEVRIGVLKHLAYFLRIIKPSKRNSYLPRLHEFLKTENDSNWRFRHELAEQLLSIVTLFSPVDSAKHIGPIAESLLHDVSAVRQVAISLITELLRHISTKPGLNSLFLVRLVETLAHSKKWNRRQTFALLCDKLLASKALQAEQFAMEIMPHLLDLSWDPVANVRLVVARTLAHHIIPNGYFADPSNQHFDSLGTIIRRLQADKDRDVRHCAEIRTKYERPMSPAPVLDFDLD